MYYVRLCNGKYIRRCTLGVSGNCELWIGKVNVEGSEANGAVTGQG